MEPIHAELLRLGRELEALRDLFARTTAAMSSSVPQHDRRLNHREAGRHLPQQFGGSRLDYGDFAFRMEGHAAVLSRDGQGGALLRGLSDNWEEPSGMLTTGCSIGSCSNHVHPRKGGNAGKKNSQCEPWRWTSRLVRSHALVQTQISGGRSGVDGEAYIAKAYQERE